MSGATNPCNMFFREESSSCRHLCEVSHRQPLCLVAVQDGLQANLREDEPQLPKRSRYRRPIAPPFIIADCRTHLVDKIFIPLDILLLIALTLWIALTLLIALALLIVHTLLHIPSLLLVLTLLLAWPMYVTRTMLIVLSLLIVLALLIVLTLLFVFTL
mmetsp:Transcript_5600/g.15689  ORF Transcript_5600/g.15689 Transcript_5600/m.15689 type:complete len:159 (+) Transcript_5600:109-585(+)